MFEFILKDYTPKPEAEKKTYLPPVKISNKCQIELDRLYYQFLLKIYLGAATEYPPINISNQISLLEEIALCQRMFNPGRTRQEYQHALQKLITEFNRIKEKIENERKSI